MQCEKRGTEFAVREARYGVCRARNEVQSLQCEKRGTEFAVRETRQSLSERELSFKNCVERIPGFPS